MKDHITGLLALLILLISFFASRDDSLTGGVVASTDVAVENLQCTFSDGRYEICGDVTWDSPQGAYAKAIADSVDDLRSTEGHRESSFHHCAVAQRTGTYAFNVYVYSDRDKLLYKHFRDKVSCERVIYPANEYRDYVSFTVEADTSRTDGQGIETLLLPDEPLSCTFIGTYETGKHLDRRYQARGAEGCEGGTGTFDGYVDAQGQHGRENADLYWWFGFQDKGKFDPPERTYDGYILYMRTCNNQYMDLEGRESGRENYVKVKVSKFGKRMELAWTYKDRESHPSVDVQAHLLCKMKTPSSSTSVAGTFGTVPEEIEIDIEGAEPLEAEEDFVYDAAVEEPRQLTWIQRLKEALERFFR